MHLLSLVCRAVGLASLGICLVCIGSLILVSGAANLPTQRTPPLAAARLSAVIEESTHQTQPTRPAFAGLRHPVPRGLNYGFPPVAAPSVLLTSPR